MSPIPERLEIKGDDRERVIGDCVRAMEALVADRGNIVPLTGEEIKFPELPSVQIKRGFRIPFGHFFHNLLPPGSNYLDGLKEYYRQFGIIIGVDWESRVALVELIEAGKEAEICLGGSRYAHRCREDGRMEGITLMTGYREVIGALLILDSEDFIYASKNGVLIGEGTDGENRVDLVALPGRRFKELNLDPPSEKLKEGWIYLISTMDYGSLPSELRTMREEISPLTILYESAKQGACQDRIFRLE
jgi:hypothetical protein